jgi:hypothetical protein
MCVVMRVVCIFLTSRISYFIFIFISILISLFTGSGLLSLSVGALGSFPLETEIPHRNASCTRLLWSISAAFPSATADLKLHWRGAKQRDF